MAIRLPPSTLPLLDAAAPGSFPHEPPVPPASVGLDGKQLARAAAMFRAQQAAGQFPGGQLVVRRRGAVVLDEVVGTARGWRASEKEPPTPVRPDTRFAVFSAGKPLVALAVAFLEERGRLDVNAPIAEVLPEFRGPGKDAITTLDVLTHRGGILMPDLIHRPEDWGDWSKVVDALAALQPTYRRGTLAYHPFEFGWVLAEIVRRVDGRTLPELVRDEITGPTSLTGLRFGATPDELPSLARTYWLGRRPVYIAGIELSQHFELINNSPRFFSAFVPGAGLVADAASLAAFYQLLVAGGVGVTGRRVLAAETIRRYTERHVFGWDRSNRYPLAVGRGFLLGTRIPSSYGWWNTEACFGHGGAFSTVAFGDHKTGLAVAIVTNGNAGHRDVIGRFIPLAHRIRAAATG